MPKAIGAAPLVLTATVRRCVAGLLALAVGVATGVAMASEARLVRNQWAVVKADGTAWEWDRLPPRPIPGPANIIAVDYGSNHRLMLTGSGEVWASGDNGYFQLGSTGSSDSSAPPRRVPGLTNIVSVAATEQSSFAVAANGQVWVWGRNKYPGIDGVLGIGSSPEISSPVVIADLPPTAHVVPNGLAIAALDRDGRVWTWGNDLMGLDSLLSLYRQPPPTTPVRVQVDSVVALDAVGNQFVMRRVGDTTWAFPNFFPFNRNSAREVPALQRFRHTVSAYGYRAGSGWAPVTIGLDADGKLWRLDPEGPVAVTWDNPFPIVELGVGQRGFIARGADGAIWVWDSDNAAGDGWYGAYTALPQAVAGLVARQVAAGRAHSLALTPAGKVYMWGATGGPYDYEHVRPVAATPVELALPPATAIAACHEHSLALTSAGAVFSWGDNARGQLGHAGTNPAAVAGLGSIVAIACGESHSLALDASGQVWGWGANDRAQLGGGSAAATTQARLVPGLDNIAAIAAGSDFGLALGRDGRAWIWGSKGGDACGPYAPPTPRPAVVASGINRISAAFIDAFMQTADGTWLGLDGCTTTPPVTIRQSFPATFAALSTGGFRYAQGGIVIGFSPGTHVAHRFGIEADGSVWGWGSNYGGELGAITDANGRQRDYVTTPSRVPYVSGIRQIAPGANHVVALHANGSVWTWGGNPYNVLAVPTPLSFVPRRVAAGFLAGDLSVATAVPNVRLKEYRLTRDGSYFYSALSSEQQTLDSGSLGPDWVATGKDFKVWLGSAGPAGTYPVCRFRGDDVAVPGYGHFYTALPSECDEVRKGKVPFWRYEGTGFYAYLPGSTCPAGTHPIYRQYNARLHNHHFQTSDQLSPLLQAEGWVMEGIPFCVGD